VGSADDTDPYPRPTGNGIGAIATASLDTGEGAVARAAILELRRETTVYRKQ
jgi:hypothetical protein